MNATNWEDALYRHYLPRCRTCVELIAESVVDCALGVLFQKRKEGSELRPTYFLFFKDGDGHAAKQCSCTISTGAVFGGGGGRFGLGS